MSTVVDAGADRLPAPSTAKTSMVFRTPASAYRIACVEPPLIGWSNRPLRYTSYTIRPVGVALSLEAPHVSQVSVSPKVLALRPAGVVGGVVSPVEDSRSVIARFSTPKNASPFQETVTKASPTALPV
jgi:hypothetical protein